MTPTLRLYTRAGCCLCQGLEERLRALNPAPMLELVDIDGDPTLQNRYDLEVPVLALLDAEGSPHQLPRVSPRLAGDQLQSWLSRHGASPPA